MQDFNLSVREQKRSFLAVEFNRLPVFVVSPRLDSYTVHKSVMESSPYLIAALALCRLCTVS